MPAGAPGLGAALTGRVRHRQMPVIDGRAAFRERRSLSPQQTDRLIAALLGPNLEAATQRLIAYLLVGTAIAAVLIRVL
jgi:hypothetical protein